MKTLEERVKDINGLGFEVQKGFVRFDVGRGEYLELNIGEDLVQDGKVSLFYKDKPYRYLENYFLDPFQPTTEEKELFEMEFGVDYPISAL